MTTLLVIIWILTTISLLLITAMRPQRTKHSIFELERLGGKAALRREHLINDVLTLRQFLMLVLTLFVGILGFGLWQTKGIVASVAVIVILVPFSRWKLVQTRAMHIYESQEKRLFRIIEKMPMFGWLFREDKWVNHDQKIESIEHLLHLVESTSHVLTPEQQSIIRHGLQWHTKTLSDVMTRRKDIIAVSKHDLLGPLVLDDLHKSGHRRFPVIQKDLDHVVGMVTIAELFEVDADKHSQTAEKLMTPLDVRLSRDTVLPDALKQLLAHPGQLLVVTDDVGNTVGIASLGDILDALIATR